MGITGDVLITGGTGTLGHAILRVARQEGWQATFTVFSRDPMKQRALKEEFPEVKLFLGDVTDRSAVEIAASGKDVIIHAAAMKHIPQAEEFPTAAIKINVEGSLNVLHAAHVLGVERVIGISTDKAVKPVNTYGATKMLMERAFQQYDEAGLVQAHLVRYGNVLGSTGSVLQAWKKMREDQGKIIATSPEMTRFWLTGRDAVCHLAYALELPSGQIFVPEMVAMSMADMYEFAGEGAPIEYTGLRPGEKMHEEVVSIEEDARCVKIPGGFLIAPPTVSEVQEPWTSRAGKTSDHPFARLVKAMFDEMFQEVL